MLHKMGSFTGSARKVSPPNTTYMTDEQKATYLSDLRNNRPARPTGSRPPPFKANTFDAATTSTGILSRSDSAPVFRPHGSQNETTEHPGMIKSTSYSSSISRKGRPLAQEPHLYKPSGGSRKASPTTSVQHVESLPDDYRDSVARKLERAEAQTLKEALHIIDQTSEEQSVYEAAQMEAAELVWRHRNPQDAEAEKTAAYYNPDAPKKKSYGSDLTHGKNQSSRVVSDASTSSQDTTTSKFSRKGSRTKHRVLSDALKDLQSASDERAAAIIAAAKSTRRRSSGVRIPSNGSHKGLFRNPEDQIYEEPDSPQNTASLATGAEFPLKAKQRNSLPRGSRPLPEKPSVIPAEITPRTNRIEIHRNTPSQSRNAAYTSNTPLPAARADTIQEVDTPKSDTLEIRGEDIRAATSMKKKDRSPKLPTPVAVSGQVGRPIVSFDPSWRPSNDSPRNSQDISRPMISLTESPRQSRELQRPLPRPLPSISEPLKSAPVIPTINLPGDDADIPSIQIDDEPTTSPSVSAPSVAASAPTAVKPPTRPLPKHASTTPSQLPSARTSRLPWLNGGTSVPTVSCSACSLPISGRIVTASGSDTAHKARFHPECFSCHHCSTALECVSFYPEPSSNRASRLVSKNQDPESTNDLRFYCHLDFHELFSPRCRSCKTPIEGQVIVAAGGEYHVGHFFCGECGDPFDSDTPFVEHNGYAYCVRCHTRRTSARCKGCRNVILEETSVEALGGKWHEECFRCVECGDDFEDGRFFVREIESALSEKEKRKGVARWEERAVCEPCEGRRLKA